MGHVTWFGLVRSNVYFIVSYFRFQLASQQEIQSPLQTFAQINTYVGLAGFELVIHHYVNMSHSSFLLQIKIHNEYHLNVKVNCQKILLIS